MSCMNDLVGSSGVSDGMHARAADYGHVKILSAFSESQTITGCLTTDCSEHHCTRHEKHSGPRVHVFVCREYHGALTEDSHSSIWGNMEGCLRRQPFQLLKIESPVHFDQAELQDGNATNTSSEGQCMLVQSSLTRGLSA